MASHHLFKNCLRRITLSQYNIEPLQTYKFLQGLSLPLMNEILWKDTTVAVCEGITF